MSQGASVFGGGQAPAVSEKVSFLEMTRCSAKWGDSEHTTVDLSAEGFIRNPNRVVRLVSKGWQSIQADGDPSPRMSLVIQVEEAVSAYPGSVPRGFFTVDNFVAPPQLNHPSNSLPEVVFCGLEPSSDLNTPPSGNMRRIRLRL